MIYYVSTNGQVIGGTAGSDLNGITHIPSSANYAIFINDATVSSLNPNNAPGTYTMTNLAATGTNGYGLPTATGTLTFTQLPAAQQLANAQQAQITLVQQGYGATITQGFTSTTDGTSRTYASDSNTLMEIGWVRSIQGSSYPTGGIPAKLNDGTHITLSYSQMQQLGTDAQNWYLAQKNQLIALTSQIQSATTLSAVQAVVWAPATY